MHFKKLLLVTGCLIIMTACMGKQNDLGLAPDESQPLELTKLRANQINGQDAANKAKNILSNYEEVKAVRAVNHNKQLLVGVELNHNDRFQMHEIEKKLKKELEKDFNDTNIHLSTDQKIHLEVKKLENAIQDEQLSDKDISKRIKKIINLSNEKT